MGSGAARGWLHCVIDGCIAAPDMEIRRRPYHRNCGCALHQSGSAAPCAAAKVSYPVRRSCPRSATLASSCSRDLAPIVSLQSPSSPLVLK